MNKKIPSTATTKKVKREKNLEITRTKNSGDLSFWNHHNYGSLYLV